MAREARLLVPVALPFSFAVAVTLAMSPFLEHGVTHEGMSQACKAGNLGCDLIVFAHFARVQEDDRTGESRRLGPSARPCEPRSRLDLRRASWRVALLLKGTRTGVCSLLGCTDFVLHGDGRDVVRASLWERDVRMARASRSCSFLIPFDGDPRRAGFHPSIRSASLEGAGN